jgi:lipid A ethanolaminephosphotransferase
MLGLQVFLTIKSAQSISKVLLLSYQINMGLKLFRSTGHSSLLDTRTAAAWQKRSPGVLGRALGRNPLIIWLIISLWMATVGNWALWRGLGKVGQMSSLGDYAFVLAFMLIIMGALCLLGGLLAWRRSVKPLLTVLLIATAMGMHFMLTYGVVIDTTMITNVLQTDPRETRDLLSLRMLVTLLVVAGLPCVWLWRQTVQRIAVPQQVMRNIMFSLASVVVIALALGLSFQNFASTMRNHTQLRYLINPLNSIYALGYLGSKPLHKGPMPFTQLGLDAKLPADAAPGAVAANPAPLLVLVVGETARTGNFQINGYTRPTTPELAALMATERMASLRNVTSCGTSTAESLPCMFNHLGREGYLGRKAEFETLVDVLQHAGMAVLWLDNQSGCKGICDRVANANTTSEKVAEHCDTGECFDKIMLHNLDARIAALPAEKRAKGVVVVMHQMGSHGPAYYKRVPAAFKKFTPECTSNALKDCTREQVVNSYDNTIAYTDHFVASTIKWLKTKEVTAQPAMIYLADHGESLGENNIYLHGLPYAIAPDVQKQVPWITWLSASFAARSKVDVACLRSRANEPASHDFYFHSVLGLLGVQTSVYRKDWDVYAPCVK